MKMKSADGRLDHEKHPSIHVVDRGRFDGREQERQDYQSQPCFRDRVRARLPIHASWGMSPFSRPGAPRSGKLTIRKMLESSMAPTPKTASDSAPTGR